MHEGGDKQIQIDELDSPKKIERRASEVLSPSKLDGELRPADN